MKILVLATNYPRPDGFVAQFFVHSRNKYYVNNGIDVSVICFRARNDYIIEGVKVYTLDSFKTKLKENKFDLLLSHAPNLRNHYLFLKQYHNKFHRIIFFFHGHEVLKQSPIYPKPYKYYSNKFSTVKSIFRNIYDEVKVIIWKKYFESIAFKAQFVFVSKWMYDMFLKFVKINPDSTNDRVHIIYNCIGENFEKSFYDTEKEKIFDFITIRNILDKSKYGIDIVTRIATQNPNFTFCIIGKGKYFDYNEKPKNLIFIDRHLKHEEIIDFLNKSRCALMPTRADAQGVMACEMATFGIPVITSNIDVCNEVFEGFANVGFINNQEEKINIKPLFEKLTKNISQRKNKKYFMENTVGKEIEFFKAVLSGKGS